MPLLEARDHLRDGRSAFIRPDHDSKLFDGGVYDSRGFAEAIDGTRVDDATPVVLAAPLIIEAEWRFFMVDGKVAGCSEYGRWNCISTLGSVPRIAIDLAAENASRWRPADVYCLDLAATADRMGICLGAPRTAALATSSGECGNERPGVD
jgi:hypothetical protein